MTQGSDQSPPDPYGPPGQYGQPGPPQAGPYGPPGHYGPPGQYQQPYGPPGQYQQPYGPPGYGPPGYGYGPPPPRRRNTGRILLIVLVVVLVLAGGCVGLGFYGYHQVRVNADEVNEFLGDLKGQNYPAAYDQLCSSGRAQGTSAEFAAAANAARDANRGVQSYDIKSVSTHNNNGVVTRTAGGTVTLTNGSVLSETFSLTKENGKLCVDSGYADLLGTG